MELKLSYNLATSEVHSATRYCTDMEEAREGIWIIDQDARTLYVNSVMADILGEDAGELIGNLSFQYIFPEDAPAAQKLFENKQRGNSNPFHFRLRRKNGEAIWVDVQGTPMHNAAGEFLGIVGTFRVAEKQAEKDAAA